MHLNLEGTELFSLVAQNFFVICYTTIFSMVCSAIIFQKKGSKLNLAIKKLFLETLKFHERTHPAQTSVVFPGKLGDMITFSEV